jgi:hypothetical protein
MDAAQKKAVREFLIEHFKFKNIVGLAGPDINEYIEWCKAKGYDEFEIFEADPSTMVSQLARLNKKVRMTFTYGDVLKADSSKKDTLYDLDFCASVRHLKQHIAKFKEHFIMTFSTRIGIQETIDTFFSARNEKIIKSEEVFDPLPHTVFTTEQGNYLFIKYCDTSAMCCFAKI